MLPPARGDVYLADLDPVRGREQAGGRPVLVISVDLFNGGPADLAVVLPITSKKRGIPWHVEVIPPEGGLRLASYIKCEDIRSISRDRLGRRLGQVGPRTILNVEDRIRILLEL